MHKTIVTAIAVLASVAAASAADLPSKTVASAPTALPTLAQYYVGVNFSGDVSKAAVYSGGAVAGWNSEFLAVEGTYDVSRPNKKVRGEYNYENTVAVNIVPQHKVPFTDITAYAFGGVGYRFNTASTVTDHSIYNIGVGAKYEFAKNLELDGRYTRIDDIKTKYHTQSPLEDRLSVGVNYKF